MNYYDEFEMGFSGLPFSVNRKFEIGGKGLIIQNSVFPFNSQKPLKIKFDDSYEYTIYGYTRILRDFKSFTVICHNPLYDLISETEKFTSCSPLKFSVIKELGFNLPIQEIIEFDLNYATETNLMDGAGKDYEDMLFFPFLRNASVNMFTVSAMMKLTTFPGFQDIEVHLQSFNDDKFGAGYTSPMVSTDYFADQHDNNKIVLATYASGALFGTEYTATDSIKVVEDTYAQGIISYKAHAEHSWVKNIRIKLLKNG